MTYQLLYSRSLNRGRKKISYLNIPEFEKEVDLSCVAFFYETRSNEQGGLIYSKEDLENFVLKYSKKPEVEEQIECLSVGEHLESLIDNYFIFSVDTPIGVPKLIRRNYDLYGLFEKNNE